jgi:hypothetical protein
MESLKKLDQICQPDVRQSFFARLDLNNPNGYRSLVLEDFYNAAESVHLHEGVPEEIRNHFQTARNLIIYSWFYYPFNVTAELCAYTSAEFALRIKSGHKTGRSSFRKLLEKAVAENWIRDEGFSHVKRKHENFQSFNESLPPEFQRPQSQLAQDYCKAMIGVLPRLRNTLAHGSTMLHQGGATTVRICADLINQLFEKPKTAKHS